MYARVSRLRHASAQVYAVAIALQLLAALGTPLCLHAADTPASAGAALQLPATYVAADALPATQVMRERRGTWTFTTGRPGAEPQQGRVVAYTPADWDGETPLPLVIFLHGAGARSEWKDSLESLYAEFLPAEIRRGRAIPAIVLCPQVSGYWGSEGSQFLDQATRAYAGRFDPDRLYLTGLSSGGGGTWTTALERTAQLAAAVPVCGIRKPTDGDAALKDLPIWAFHNVHDPYQKVAYTRAHVEAIRAAGGRYLRYTEYDATPGKSHPGKDGEPVFPRCHAQAWEAAYTDAALWTWLFRQRRGQPDLALEP